MVAPSWPVAPKDWRCTETSTGDVVRQATGWVVTRVPAGFEKIMEGFRKLRGRGERVAHLVFSDGLVSRVGVHRAARGPVGAGRIRAQGGLNVYSVRHDDHVITVMGETPSATVRQIANSVERR